MTKRPLAALALAIFASAAFAQDDSAPQPKPEPEETVQQAQANPPTPPQTPTDQQNPPSTPISPPPVEAPSQGVLSQAASSTYERRDSFPNVNIYLPEGQASLRLRRLIRNVLFESQIEYNFIDGDISTFLRYKYYARTFTYRLGVFDTIEFPEVGSNNAQEFERVRGGLVLVEFPRDYNNRYFWLVQDDRLTFGEIENVDNKKNNIYTKIGYQYGTQFDERMNQIVGETRGRITPVLTAFRELGPQKFGLAAAITQSAEIGPGDYKYTKFETEALKRFDVTATSFFVSRFHIGTFVGRDFLNRQPYDRDGDGDLDEVPEWEQYSIPRYELFRLGGREALKAVRASAVGQGTHETHLTNEYFVPVFRNRDYRTGPLHWNTMYAIGYLGAGTVGFDFDDMRDSKRFVVDAGVGAETSLTLRDFEVLFSVIYARTLRAPSAAELGLTDGDGLKGDRWLFSIRTIR